MVLSDGAADLIAGLALSCGTCGETYPLADLAWRCRRCAGLLDLTGFTPRLTKPADLPQCPAGLWRFAAALPVPEDADISMGEGGTPMVAAPGRPGVALKLDYLMPTGSFKDRGAVLLAILARLIGVRHMAADSSGNAGAAVAAYAARARIGCEVFVPEATSPGKVAQLEAYGAVVRQVAGSRADTAEAARAAADRPGVFYASHVYNPVFFHGTKTYVLELWHDLDGWLPQNLVLPAGNGTLVLGAHMALRELADHGLIEAMPRIIAVQSAACSPLATAFADGSEPVPPTAVTQTVAEGIAIASPARTPQIIRAIRDTGGTIVAVPEDAIVSAQAELARMGFYVEPTAAVCWAALQSGLVPAPQDETAAVHTVIPLCGSGLKSTPPPPPPPGPAPGVSRVADRSRTT